MGPREFEAAQSDVRALNQAFVLVFRATENLRTPSLRTKTLRLLVDLVSAACDPDMRLDRKDG